MLKPESTTGNTDNLAVDISGTNCSPTLAPQGKSSQMLEGLRCPGKLTERHKFFPFVNMAEDLGVYSLP